MCVCVCVFHILFSETIQEEKTLFCSFWSDRKPRRLWATRDSGTGFWWRKVWSSLSGLLDSWLDSVSGWGALFELISLSKWKAEIANRCSFQPYVTESPWAGQTEPIVPGCIFVFDGAGGGNLGFAHTERERVRFCWATPQPGTALKTRWWVWKSSFMGALGFVTSKPMKKTQA